MGGGEGESRSLPQVPGRVVEEGRRKEVDLLGDNKQCS